MLEITGKLRDRFVQVAVLLYMLDPVRGEATSHNLDHDPYEIESPHERLLKKKFLDSFALLCSIRKDAESVSAACMEEGAPEGTIIRVASNSGVHQRTLLQLQQISDVLNKVAGTSSHVPDVESSILLQIIQLDIAKVRHYLSDIQNSKDLCGNRLLDIEQSLQTPQDMALPFNSVSVEQLQDWLRHISIIQSLPLGVDPQDLILTLQWAQESKRHHLEFIKNAFSIESSRLPRWMLAIFKLGRYGIGSKVLVQFASKYPALFNPMIVKSIAEPSSTRFTLAGQEPTLIRVLRRVAGASADGHLTRLAKVWNATDPEASFRTACSRNLTVHAEMQLVSFYDHNPISKPSFRFIGVSKKSCYLCRMFLTTHPESFTTSSCHQKLYPSWNPPLATDPRVYRNYKALTTNVSKIMEAAAKEELETRLGTSRRPIPADSTAGVSLSGLTSSDVAARTGYIPISSWTITSGDLRDGESVTHLENENKIQSEQVLSQIEVVDLTTHRDKPCATFLEIPPFMEMAILFTSAEDAARQDIVQMSDIFDPSTNKLSWFKLVKILEASMCFNEGRDFLLVNAKIQVSDERQFFACLQYLHNLNVLSLQASVCSSLVPLLV